MSSSHVTLYADKGARGPNPSKVAILLEKLGLEYDVEGKIFGADEGGVKHPDFLKINPNGRVPAIADHKNADFVVWESGACLIYLAEKYDAEGKFYGKTPEDKAVVAQWLAYQLSGLGPVQGNANYALHFWKGTYGEDAAPSVVKRFTDEVNRVYSVLEDQLAKQAARGSQWIALDRPTIADFAFYPWVDKAGFAKIDLAAYPHVQKWVETLKADKDVVAAYAKLAAV